LKLEAGPEIALPPSIYTAEEFIAAVWQQISDKSFQMIRFEKTTSYLFYLGL